MKIPVIVYVVFFIIAGCSRNSDIDKYHDLVKKELATNKRADSIFFGIHLGMNQKKFFAHCWEMNKKGIFTNGSDGLGSMYVLYKLDKELQYPAGMNFYPDFTDSAISGMRVNIQYNAWAPWNKKMYSDSLLPDVLKLLTEWYPAGNAFIELKDAKRGVIYVKVDGNRRITVGKYDDMIVKIDYTDMLAEEKNKGRK